VERALSSRPFVPCTDVSLDSVRQASLLRLARLTRPSVMRSDACTALTNGTTVGSTFALQSKTSPSTPLSYAQRYPQTVCAMEACALSCKLHPASSALVLTCGVLQALTFSKLQGYPKHTPDGCITLAALMLRSREHSYMTIMYCRNCRVVCTPDERRSWGR